MLALIVEGREYSSEFDIQVLCWWGDFDGKEVSWFLNIYLILNRDKKIPQGVILWDFFGIS